MTQGFGPNWNRKQAQINSELWPKGYGPNWNTKQAQINSELWPKGYGPNWNTKQTQMNNLLPVSTSSTVRSESKRAKSFSAVDAKSLM